MDNHLGPIFTYGIITFVIWLTVMPYFIEYVIRLKLWKQIREEATIGKATEFSKLHKQKAWTPTMWWAAIIWVVMVMVIVSFILQNFGIITNSLLNQKETYLSVFTLLSVWILGWIDDFMNIKWIGRTKWLSARFKMLWLIIFATLWAWWFYWKLWWNVVDDLWNYVRTLAVPFIWDIQLGWLFIPFFIFIIIAASNSVNITDWLDGLAWWLLLFAYSVYAYITYDQWLFLLSTLCIVIIWALLAFLWYNVKPAKIYMWDVWSLALGANLWIMAMLTNTVFIFIIISAIFIFETLSVVIQLTSKKFRNGKKIFRIAPFHHHLEAIWWSEENVVFRLWLVGIVLSAFWIIIYGIQNVI